MFANYTIRIDIQATFKIKMIQSGEEEMLQKYKNHDYQMHFWVEQKLTSFLFNRRRIIL